MTRSPVQSGLAGVIVTETVMSHVDGERGELLLAGHDVRSLAGQRSYDEVCGLLWPDSERASIAQHIGAGRVRAYESLPRLGDALTADTGMDALRAAVAHWRVHDGDAMDSAAELIGAMAVFAAAWWRSANGQAPIAPDPSLGVAADYWRMIHDRAASDAIARALDAYFVTVSEHGMNASTFAARVVTSTGSDLVSAVVAALGALKGPLHGGAPGPVLDMLDAVASAERAGAWLDDELAAGRRIMGMGHRVYRVRDPRAAVLERAAQELADADASGRVAARLSLARAVEQAATERLAERHPGRALRANVEFYTAVLLDALDIDRRLFSPTFAIARTAGWCGHIAEQRAHGRLIRPKARYVGPRYPD